MAHDVRHVALARSDALSASRRRMEQDEPAITANKREGMIRKPKPAHRIVVTSLIALIGVSGSPLTAQQTRQCVAPTDEITRYLSDVDAFFRGVGGSAAIAVDGRIVYSGAWGMADLEHSVPVSAQTRFFMASVTKAFTGIALLKAAEEGHVRLDAPIASYVPALVTPGAQSITADLLAAHLSGIREWRPEERTLAFLSAHHDNVFDALTLVATDSLVAPPGTRYVYSSLGYDVLAAAIQAATGRTFQDYLAQKILRPLGLTNTSFDDIRKIVPSRARGYSYWYPWFSRQSSDTLRNVPSFDYSINSGGGNMLSTSEDLVRFGAALISPGLLTAHSLRRLRSRIATGSNWTYGFVLDSDGALGSVLRITGSDPGYQASLLIYPDRRIAVALLQNSWGLRATPPAEYADPVARMLSMCLGTR
jgi:CubicO group peptidase (beta-lactamase class C family)